MKSSNPTATPESLISSSPSESETIEPSRSTPSSIKDVAGNAKRSAGKALNEAKEKAASLAREQKQSAAEHIGRYGSALRDSARSVEQEDPNVAYFANRAAERIQKVADYVRSTDLDGIRRDAEDLARRRPALFMGGMFIAGIILGGLVKASAKTIREDSSASMGQSSDEPYVEPLDSPGTIASQTASSL